MRAYTAHALGEIGPPARGAAEALIAALADEDATVRRLARDSLYDIKPGKDVALPLFVKMLNNASHADAAAAVRTLAEAGEEAVPILIEALNDKEASYWACLALSEIGPPAAAAVPKLGTVLESDEPETRMEALEALAAIGAASQPLAGKIAERLSKDDAQSVRYAAAYALGSIGDKKTALPALTQALDDKDEFLRVAAAWAIVRLMENEQSAGLEKAVKIIVDGMASDDPRVRQVAARAMGDPDLPIEVLAPAFRKVLQGVKDPEKLMEIVDGLASLGAKVVPSCIRSLEEKAPLRYYAMQLLIRVSPDAAPAVPALSMTLADPDPIMRREVALRLGGHRSGVGQSHRQDCGEARRRGSGSPPCHVLCAGQDRSGGSGGVAEAARGHGQRRRVPAIGRRVGIFEDLSQGRGTQTESGAVSREGACGRAGAYPH